MGTLERESGIRAALTPNTVGRAWIEAETGEFLLGGAGILADARRAAGGLHVGAGNIGLGIGPGRLAEIHVLRIGGGAGDGARACADGGATRMNWNCTRSGWRMTETPPSESWQRKVPPSLCNT